MSQEIQGLEYLKKNEIKNMKCDMGKPFAFISYSHHEHDSQIVRNVFKQLMKKGYNLWIDVANIPVNEDSWKKPANSALLNKNCKVIIFFRSEKSLVTPNIKEELTKRGKYKHIKSIVVIDVWHADGMNADKFFNDIINSDDEMINSDDDKDVTKKMREERRTVCDSICNIVDIDCNAIRLASDAENDILNLVGQMEDVLQEIKSSTTESIEKTSVIDNSEKIVSANESYVGVVNKSTLLKDFEKLCESVDFCVALGNARSNIRHGGKGLFDYLMAALLRGCDADIYDKKNNRIVRLAGYNYNKYAVAENPDDPKTSDIQYPWTWTTNCRKSIKKEDIPERFFNEKGKVKSGRLEDFNKIFEELEPETSIGEVLEKFEKCEKGFDTKDNKLILEAWDLIESINLNSGKKGLQEIL